MRTFPDLLRLIRENDQNYEVRYRLILEALAVARKHGYAAGIRIDPAEPEWPVAFIELPVVGQISWHLPQHPVEWDGHDTEEKWRRIEAFAATWPKGPLPDGHTEWQMTGYQRMTAPEFTLDCEEE